MKEENDQPSVTAKLDAHEQPSTEIGMSFGNKFQHWLEHAALAAAGAALLTATAAPITRATTGTSDHSSSPDSASLSTVALASDSLCAQDFASAVDAIASRPQFASATWGIAVRSLYDDATLYSLNSDVLMIPASNVKLLTTAAAIQMISERAPQALLSYRDLLTIINRHSDNFQADELLRSIGGQLMVNQSLTALGVTPDSYVQADGSGLSRSNRIRPSAIVTLLKAMRELDSTGIFYDSLSVGGVNGTLRNRFGGTPVQGRLHGKTGTLNGVRALSGYLETDNYGTVVFSVVINQPGQSGGVMLDAIDEMVLEMSRLTVCG
jgi:D-alanyl-D-alanine carboxypeptidase/D-alanyl-D-alanine-endopeptidase (penicillin-binding protein 4)